MKIDFDRVIERSGTGSFKWDMPDPGADADTIPLWVADMDFQAPAAVIAAIDKRVRHGIFGYSLRPDSYYQAVTGWMKRRFDWEVDKKWIVFTPGIVPALHFAVQAFTEPGEGVIIQPPVYPPFARSVEINGRRLIHNPLLEKGGRYWMDLERLERQIDPTVRLLLLCSPHNPVGRVWSRDELERLADLCIRRDLIVVSDEIHADLVLPGRQHVPLAALSPEIADRTISCTAPNKSFNIPDFHMGNIVISNSSLRRRFNHAINVCGIGLSSAIGVAATEAAYTHGEEWLEELMAYIALNVRFLESFCRDQLPKVRVSPCEGTYLAWLDFREYGLSGKEMYELLLQKAKVKLEEGSRFGPGGEGFQRINLGCPRSRLRQALERMAKVLRDAARG